MRAWLAAACMIVLVGSIVVDVADAGGGRREGAKAARAAAAKVVDAGAAEVTGIPVPVVEPR